MLSRSHFHYKRNKYIPNNSKKFQISGQFNVQSNVRTLLVTYYSSQVHSIYHKPFSVLQYLLKTFTQWMNFSSMRVTFVRSSTNSQFVLIILRILTISKKVQATLEAFVRGSATKEKHLVVSVDPGHWDVQSYTVKH